MVFGRASRKKKIVSAKNIYSILNLTIGHVWIFQPDNNPKTNLKNNTKRGH